MAESYFSEPVLAWYLDKLSDEEFWMFKELLMLELPQLHLPPIPQFDVNTTSKEELTRMLLLYYPGRPVWEITLSLLVQMDRKDLWIKAQEEIGNTTFSYRKEMSGKFQQVWDKETCLQVSDGFYKKSVRHQRLSLRNAFAYQQQVGAVTAVLSGPEGVGKTTLLRRLMLDWTEGALWEGRFLFVFFFTVYELNSVLETSLVELVSRDWLKPLDVLNHTFSQPEKILFILDGFERLKFDLGIRTDLGTDWAQRQPTPNLLSSLLQKTLLPESSLLLGLRDTTETTSIRYLLKEPREITISYFSDPLVELYFSHFFPVPEHASRALAFVQSRSDLLSVCTRPIFCWMICSCLKWQLEAGGRFEISAYNITYLYVSFLTSAFKGRDEKCSVANNRAQLRRLCMLAAEGMWMHVFVFSSGDLDRFGISAADVILWLSLKLLQPSGRDFAFSGLAMQSFCAAMFYFFEEPADSAFGSVAQLVSAILRDRQSHLFVEGVFVYGLTNENARRELETSFGFSLSKNIKQELLQGLVPLLECEHGAATQSLPELFQGLTETQDQVFIKSVLDLFEEMSLTICEMDHFIVVASCLEECQRLKELRLCIQKIFADPGDIRDVQDDRSNRNFRGHRGKNGDMHEFRKFLRAINHLPCLQKLELHRLKITDKCLHSLFTELVPPPSLQSLWSSFMPTGSYGQALFKAVLLGPSLRQLNLYGTDFQSPLMFLYQTLMEAGNTVDNLMLGKCDILTKDCDNFSCLIKYRKLKCLSLVENPIGNRGVKFLCEGLKDPNCILESLMLSYCCLSHIACDFIAQALRVNRTLSLLDMGSNFLEDVGAENLCKALRRPSCSLQELWLTGCYFTSRCCEDFSAALIHNRNLKTLKLGNNEIQDSGVKLLCRALQHPNCRLQKLGLDMCPLTSGCCGDLALALIRSRSLRSLNLDWVAFSHAGVEVLCEALSHQDCALELLGLDKAVLDEESQKLLEGVEKRDPPLTIKHLPWLREEDLLRGIPG
ncbi:NACHT, LRR and PYD domains-containing protein 9 [Perognathus longimembris pacificus]|uniref:NACHT, LRR and PYD domains-containing protein 9 n=1 Tax=Perognathus longimembris pacificus TaxID=214514 RepID=UPI00201A0E7D|nr:NACHT, LRR and PYD domains-containing protein 9 [Perognathus longimembris pacificus]